MSYSINERFSYAHARRSLQNDIAVCWDVCCDNCVSMWYVDFK